MVLELRTNIKRTTKDTMRLSNIAALAVGAMVCCLSRAEVAYGQIDPWEFEVYPYATEGRGVVEIETTNAVVANGHSSAPNGTAKGTYPSQGMWYNAYEFTSDGTPNLSGTRHHSSTMLISNSS